MSGPPWVSQLTCRSRGEPCTPAGHRPIRPLLLPTTRRSRHRLGQDRSGSKSGSRASSILPGQRMRACVSGDSPKGQRMCEDIIERKKRYGNRWDRMSCATMSAVVGLERLFGNPDGGWAPLHLQPMPGVLELFSGRLEHHNGLLNHILYQDVLAV